MKKESKSPERFGKSAFLSAEQYQDRRDLVEALLFGETEYTEDEVAEIISKYLEREVE